MAQGQNYQRDKNGIRFQPGGIDTVNPSDALPPTKYAYLQNVRALKQLQITGRPTVGSALVSGLPTPIHSLQILNDTTPDGPTQGYVRVIGAAGEMYVNSTEVASGLSGNPVSICPFRPNTSVRPWAYVYDSSENIVITSNSFPSGNGIKINSSGITQKIGVKEPQQYPTVSTQSYTTTGTDALPATTIPWTNVGGANSAYNYGQTSATDGTAPIIVTGGGPYLVAGSSITLSISGSATVTPYGAVTVPPSPTGNTTSTYPGSATGISGTASIFIGAFTDSSGNVVAPGGSTPLVFFINPSGTTVTVPATAQQLQIGVDSSANTFSNNSGSFTLSWSVTVSAIATVISTIGDVTAYVWGTPPPTGGGSPHSGPVAQYIWKNPNDTGAGTPRSITDPVPDVTATNNSWVFDSSPEDGTVPVNWNVLNTDGSIGSAIPLFSPALETEGYQDFNCCMVGNLFVPAAGTYNLTFAYKDQIMVGFGGGATASYVSGTSPLSTSPVGSFGQTISVVESLPLVFVSNPNGSGGQQTTVMAVTFPGTGVYKLEIDWDYWYHTGRSLIVTTPSSSPNSPTIPPLPISVRTGVQYRYVYRSSSTGALSNPSPESPIQQTPVLANLVTPTYSPDPQVDKVDYYRLGDNLTNFTYVATGPNTNPPTPIEDELSDTAIAANNILAYDNYEPFPVIDLPHSGVVDVTGGIISWVSGDKFNIRWLPGTDILIGYPTSVAYSFVSRPYPNVFQNSYAYELGEIILDPSSHYQQITTAGTSQSSGTPTWNDSGGTTTSGGAIFQDMGTVFNGNGYVTLINLPDVPDGTHLDYEIPEPDLAAQALPYVFGPTDNTAYDFGVGDKLNPGTLYFTRGNNPDSAPQTNQIAVTSPDEPLMNGVKTAAMAMVWTPERRWLIYPTFTTALATVQGVSGTPFNVVEATGSRGLYIPRCVCTDGGYTAFFRAKDGIYTSVFGGEDKFICGDIFNLFPRDGFEPSPITIAGNTIYPPDDTKPNAQKLSYGPGYLFYNYEDTNGNRRTLVYDEIAQGWIVDVGQYPFTVHAWEDGPDTNTFMVGCSDGSVRELGSGNTETCTSIVVPGCQNAGDARAFKRIGDVYVQAIIATSNPIGVGLYTNRYTTSLSGFSPTSLTGTGSLIPYIIDFTSGYGDELIDVGIVLSWNTSSLDVLDLWSPSFTFFPENTQDRPTDWTDGGYPGNKFMQGLLLECNTFGSAKAISVQRSDDFTIFTPNESPITAAHQQIVPLTFTPPFNAHQARIISTDGVPWRHGPDLGWNLSWVFQPLPESVVEWQTDLDSLDGLGWQHLRLVNLSYQSTAPVTLSFTVDTGNGSIAPNPITFPSSAGNKTKTFVQVSPNKWKLIAFRVSSASPVMVFKGDIELWIRSWGDTGEYRKIKPWGGDSGPGAQI